MTEDLQEVRTALQKRFGDNEKEIELMLGRYVGQHLTIRSFFRDWLHERLAEQATWMMNLINVELIADTAVALGRVITVPAKPANQLRRGVYVFLATS
jgi:hypothetical protein